MKIGIVTEIEFKDIVKIPREYPNMRTEFVWANMLDADMISYTMFSDPNKYLNIMETYDFLLFIPSKNRPEYLIHIKNCPIPHGIMQEGGRYQWLEWNTKYQELYLECLKCATVVLCHNESDVDYFKQFTDRPVEKLGTYIFVDDYKNMVNGHRKENIFVAGNHTAWYGGRHSYEAIKDYKWNVIGFPTMSRRQDDEQDVLETKDCRIIYHDYKAVIEFAKELSHYKYAIHLMPISAAGSISLLCACLEIPFIGNLSNDTDRLLFPELVVYPNYPTVIDHAKRNLEYLLVEQNYEWTIDYANKQLHLFDADKQRVTLQKQFKRYISI